MTPPRDPSGGRDEGRGVKFPAPRGVPFSGRVALLHGPVPLRGREVVGHAE